MEGRILMNIRHLDVYVPRAGIQGCSATLSDRGKYAENRKQISGEAAHIT